MATGSAAASEEARRRANFTYSLKRRSVVGWVDDRAAAGERSTVTTAPEGAEGEPGAVGESEGVGSKRASAEVSAGARRAMGRRASVAAAARNKSVIGTAKPAELRVENDWRSAPTPSNAQATSQQAASRQLGHLARLSRGRSS